MQQRNETEKSAQDLDVAVVGGGVSNVYSA